jgi:hypothetical protein
MIPPLERGLLPVGVWDCTLAEIAETFALTPQRAALFARLRRFLDDVANLPHAPLFIDGSFVTDKIEPADIDLCADLDSLSPDDRLPWERIFYAERWYLEKEGIDYWFRSPDFPEDVTTTEFPRVKAVDAERLNLPKQVRKGFLRLP